MYGHKHASNSGITGYLGMFWGSVRNEDGTNLKSTKKYGEEIVESDSANDFFFDIEDGGNEAWDIINDKLHRHLHKHIGKVDRIKYHWQCGFGLFFSKRTVLLTSPPAGRRRGRRPRAPR